MDSVTLTKQNRLFWLGRYAERLYQNVQYMMDQHDALLDGAGADYKEFCQKLGIPCPYESAEDFCLRYLYDENDPNSVRSIAENMLGNGMVLRETITTPTLAYLQMARNAVLLAQKSDSPDVELQWVLDDIMAFRGSFDDAVDLENVRNITKTGGFIERISLTLRMGWHEERLDRELKKLLNRLYKTDLTASQAAVDTLTRYAVEEQPVEKAELLNAVENLFQV